MGYEGGMHGLAYIEPLPTRMTLGATVGAEGEETDVVASGLDCLMGKAEHAMEGTHWLRP